MDIKHAKPTLSNRPGRREHAACRSKMPAQTWQGDEWRKPWISNMPSRRCQTGQADVNMQPAGQKCQLKHGRETNGVSHGYQTCQADAKKGHLKAKKATWRPKMPAKTWQGDVSYLSNNLFIYLPISIYLCIYLSIYRSICQTCQADVNMQPAGQKCQVKHGRETNGVSHGYQTCQADAVKPARPTWTCSLQVKNASSNMAGRRMA